MIQIPLYCTLILTTKAFLHFIQHGRLLCLHLEEVCTVFGLNCVQFVGGKEGKQREGDQEGKQWSDNSECLKKKEGVERNANERM